MARMLHPCCARRTDKTYKLDVQIVHTERSIGSVEWRESGSGCSFLPAYSFSFGNYSASSVPTKTDLGVVKDSSGRVAPESSAANRH